MARLGRRQSFKTIINKQIPASAGTVYTAACSFQTYSYLDDSAKIISIAPLIISDNSYIYNNSHAVLTINETINPQSYLDEQGRGVYGGGILCVDNSILISNGRIIADVGLIVTDNSVLLGSGSIVGGGTIYFGQSLLYNYSYFTSNARLVANTPINIFDKSQFIDSATIIVRVLEQCYSTSNLDLHGKAICGGGILIKDVSSLSEVLRYFVHCGVSTDDYSVLIGNATKVGAGQFGTASLQIFSSFLANINKVAETSFVGSIYSGIGLDGKCVISAPINICDKSFTNFNTNTIFFANWIGNGQSYVVINNRTVRIIGSWSKLYLRRYLDFNLGLKA